MENKKKIVFFTKEPVEYERVIGLEELLLLNNIEIIAIFVEDAMHLSFWRFIFRTLKRVWKGYIYLPEFVKHVFKFVFPIKTDKVDTLTIDKIAKKNNIPLYRVKNSAEEKVLNLVKTLDPDIGIIFGHRILPERLFNIPKEGSINVHYGILPRYAGSHSTFWSLVEGAKEVGITIHRVTSLVDSGDILFMKRVPVHQKKVVFLEKQLVKIAPQALKIAINGLVKGELKFKKQNSGKWKYWKPPNLIERLKHK